MMYIHCAGERGEHCEWSRARQGGKGGQKGAGPGPLSHYRWVGSSSLRPPAAQARAPGRQDAAR